MKKTRTQRKANQQTQQTVPEPETSRDWVLQKLHSILEIAMDRVENHKTSPQERIKWSRIVIAGGQACNSVLRDVEIDDLKQQIKELKELTLAKLSDEQESDQGRNTETTTDD